MLFELKSTANSWTSGALSHLNVLPHAVCYFSALYLQLYTLAATLMQALFDLEATNQELKGDLRDLYITSAAEIDVGSTRKAIVIHVSPPARGS